MNDHDGEMIGRTVRACGVAALVAGGVYVGVLAVNRCLVRVEGPSMEPALWPSDVLVTVPAHRWWLAPGQVVVVAAPRRSDRAVKRLLDLDRDTVEVRGDADDRSTDSRTWGRLPIRAVRRIALRRWPDLLSSLRRSPVDGR